MAGEIAAVSMEDVDKLLAACSDDRYRVIVLLAAEAGLRAGEIRGLQWTDIKDGQLIVRRALDPQTNEVIAPKHNKARNVPLSPRLAAALGALPCRGVWVVTTLEGRALGYWTMIEAVGATYDRAGAPRAPKLIHCLRHTFGTVMAKKVPLGVLQKLMGHSEVTTTMRYVDVSEDDKREAIASVFGTAEPGVAATRQRGCTK
jgi:integrase